MNQPAVDRPVLLADDFPLSRRCLPGEVLRLDLDACAISLQHDTATLHMPPPQENFTVPTDVPSFLVSLRDVHVSVGFQNLLNYRIENPPDQLFPLGFHGGMTVHVAHAHGFSSVLRRSLASSEPTISLFSLLSEGLRPLAVRAMHDVLNDTFPAYREILHQRTALQSALEAAFFPKLYVCGLCLHPHSFVIEGFSKPMFHIHAK